MIKQNFLAATLLYLSLVLSPEINAQASFDTIVKVEGTMLVVDVTIVTDKYVSFKVLGKQQIYTMERKEINKIIYKNGRVEAYNSMVVTDISPDSWKFVFLTDDKKKMVYLHKRGKISASAPPSFRSPKAAKANAEIILKKQAAALKGSYVLITKRQATGGYGDFSGYYLEGIAYGEQALEEEFVDGSKIGSK